MSPELILLIVIVAAALLFDFFNGFNDAANSIARSLPPGAQPASGRAVGGLL